MIISTNPQLDGYGSGPGSGWVAPAPADAGPRPSPLDAERILRHMTPAQAHKVLLRGRSEAWMRSAKVESLGLYRFPAVEYEGLDWPGLVLRIYLEREHNDGRRTLMAQAYAAVYVTEDGEQEVQWIDRAPEDNRRWGG